MTDGRLSNEELVAEASRRTLKASGETPAQVAQRVTENIVGGWYRLTDCGDNAIMALLVSELATLQRSAEVMRLALNYALPIVEKYAHTQGDNAAFHAKVTEPIRAALKALPPQQDAKDGATG
jgi:hypothetical protein